MAKQNEKELERAVYQSFKKELSDGKLGSLYLFHGEESYLRDYYLEQMKKKLLPPGMESFNYHTLQGKTLSMESLSGLVDALPMMSERTLLVVEDYDLFKAPEAERTQMVALLEDLPDYCCLVFLYRTIPYKGDGRIKKLTAVLNERGKIVSFARQSQADLTDWIGRRFRALGHSITREDAQYLIFLCGDLMHGLIPEIEKIASYAKTERITKRDIDAVAIPIVEAVVFQMTDALTAKDFDKAFAILNDLYTLRQEPIMILAVLGRHFRHLYTARIALENNHTSRFVMSLCGMRSSYPAEKLMQTAHRYGTGWCKHAMKRCAETDLTMKSVSGVEPKELLLSLLLELCVGGTSC